VKVALRQRERLAMLRAREGVLVLQTLLWPDEVREPKLDFSDDDVKVRDQELAMAESYINALSGDFEPEEFSDEYRGALEQVIEAKVAGREVVAVAEEPESTGQVVDLMDALRRSVAEAKARRGESAGEKAEKPPATKSAGDKSAAKKTGKTAAKKTATKAATKATKETAAKKTAATKKTAARKSA
jgi:DNA end-binding protein Ku